MSEQYFNQAPSSQSHEKTIQGKFLGMSFDFITDHGVFSKNQVDYGSIVLAETFADQSQLDQGRVLELGSGYGPITLALAKRFPQADFVGVEINPRAYELSKKNQVINQVDNVSFYLDDVGQFETAAVQHVLTNPPIRAGKAVIQGFVSQAYHLLSPGGSLWLVIQKKQGAPSMRKFMETTFGNVERVQLDKGYWILKSTKKD